MEANPERKRRLSQSSSSDGDHIGLGKRHKRSDQSSRADPADTEPSSSGDVPKNVSTTTERVSERSRKLYDQFLSSGIVQISQKNVMGDVKPTQEAGHQGFGFVSESSHNEPVSKDTPSAPTQRFTPPQVNYSSVAQKLMAQMGHQQGQGLGKGGTGIVEPVNHSDQRGRRGLGHEIKSLKQRTVEWDPLKEHISVHEEVKWLPQCTQILPSLAQLRSWKSLGPKMSSIDAETQFCDPEVLKNVLKSKSVFDELETRELMQARTRSNPFESIRKMIFQNRAAMKMANMDAVFDFMFTEPTTPEGRPSLGPNEPLFFADVCAGPGGFSEYVLWRKKWRSKGFGFTLKETNDFKLDDFLAGPPETFETHYGVGGQDGNGNVFQQENIKTFTKFVLDSTQGQGVHFMMADGGFGVEGQENIQEILSKRLYLCQFLVAMGIVRTGGHFVCKLFDIFTQFSVGLVYLLYRSFDHVCIHKPNTSRPANSERYIICKWKRQDTKSVQEYMLEINDHLAQLELSQSNEDVTELVPINVLVQDQDFVAYITESNNQLGTWQTMALAKLKAFCLHPTLQETRQFDMRENCLKYWNIPDEVRKRPPTKGPEEIFIELLGGSVDDFDTSALQLTVDNLRGNIESVFDWKVVYLANPDHERTLFLGVGRSTVYQRIVSGDQCSKNWTILTKPLKFELPPRSLILGEIARELRGEGKGMKKVCTLHIIDGFFIGGEDIRELDLKSRHAQLRLLTQTVNKGSKSDLSEIRVKELHSLETLTDSLREIELKRLKGSGSLLRLTRPIEDSKDPLPRCYCPSGILFIRVVKDPFVVALSKRNNRKYFFNTHTSQSFSDCPTEALMAADEAYSQMKVWLWTEGVQLYPDQPGLKDKSKVHMDTIVPHIRNHIVQ